jgi:thioredoxin 1
MEDSFPKANDHNFAEIITLQKKVLIYFSSSSCGRCIIAKQNLLEVLPHFKDLIVFECKVEDAPKIVDKYKITSIPQTKLFIDGEPSYTAFGIRNSQDLYYDLQMF